ncbi:hypothetical protein [Nonomuraea dietziae]|uniref:Tetratricopeptide (TPR) repeat protein n=1 Tax=Nonomuraea dietziae TaxID=65515 RepID=A0A7W5YNV6_9ACTN|nr:hypothetical protein [Nonomuraea dietziae]MBB3727882.1 tetratricopeptide (TPR) repeat protein [Nonomuraea dietziae]
MTLHEIKPVATLRTPVVEIAPVTRESDLNAELDSKVSELRRRMAEEGRGEGLRIKLADQSVADLSLVIESEEEGLLQDARVNVASGSYDLALELLDELLELAPRHQEGRYLTACCHYGKGGDGLRHALRLLRPLRDEPLAEELAEQVRQLRAELRRVLTPSEVIEFAALAQADRGAATARMREFIELAPEEGSCYQVLAISLASTGAAEEALAVVEGGLAVAEQDRAPVEALARRLRIMLLRPRAAAALDAFKTGGYERALAELRRLEPRWRGLPVARDLDDYLAELAATGRLAAPKVPFDRAEDLYSLIAEQEASIALTLLNEGRMEQAEPLLTAALGYVPLFPWMNFLYALCLYLRGGDTVRSGRAVEIALRDPTIAQAAELRQAIMAQREAQLINPLVLRFNAILEHVPAEGHTAESLDQMAQRLRALGEEVPGLHQRMLTPAGEATLERLSEAVRTNLIDVLELMEFAQLSEEFGQIMSQARGVPGSRLRARLSALDGKVRRRARDADVGRKHFDDLTAAIRQAMAALGEQDLVVRFNALFEGRPPDRWRLSQELDAIASEIPGVRSSANPDTVRRLDDLDQAIRRIKRQIS